MFRGITVVYTFPGKNQLDLLGHLMARLVRPSNMVSSTPLDLQLSGSVPGARCAPCPSGRAPPARIPPALAPSRLSAAHRALRVSSSREGGQSMNISRSAPPPLIQGSLQQELAALHVDHLYACASQSLVAG